MARLSYGHPYLRAHRSWPNVVLAAVVGLAFVTVPSDAGAQVWHPKSQKKHNKTATEQETPAEKPTNARNRRRWRRIAPRKGRLPAARPKPAPEPKAEKDEPAETDSADEAGPEREDPSGSRSGGARGPNDGGDSDAEVPTDGESSDDEFRGMDGSGDSSSAGTLSIGDDLDNVGPGAELSSDDFQLTQEEDVQPGTSVRRLETLAMAFGRFGSDVVHDEVPPAANGIGTIGENTIRLEGHARAEGVGRFGRSSKVKVAGRVSADLAVDSNSQIGLQRYEAVVWDTYLDIYKDWADMRFGKQIAAWGAGDIINPNDVVNARDLRRGLLASVDELRIPVLAASITVFTGPLSLQGIWIPVAPTNRFELLDGDFSLLGPNAPSVAERRVGSIISSLADDPTYGIPLAPLLAIADEPEQSLETGELAARLAMRLRRVDLAAYFLWGHERLPNVAVAPQLVDMFVTTPPETLTPQLIAEQVGALAMMGIPIVTTDYRRKLHFGASVAGRVEPLGLKLDLAYQPETVAIVVPPGAGPLLGQGAILPWLSVAASLDYDRGDELSIVAELGYTKYLDVPPGRSVYQMDIDQTWIAATSMAWSPTNNPLSVRLLAIVDLPSPSYALQPALRLSGHDNISLELAATVFGGPAGSLGGLADRNDELTMTVQYGL